MCGIYKITNKMNGKIYIGQSVNIEHRWTQHRNRPFNPLSSQYDSYFYRSIRKYGLENFTFEVIEQCTKQELNQKEQYWIHYYNSNVSDVGYNLTDGGATIVSKLKQQQVEEIIYLLSNTELTQEEIAQKYNMSQRLISAINLGQVWIKENTSYPIRSKRANAHQENFCIDCGKQISKTANRCMSCEKKQRRIVLRPNREELKTLIREESFLEIGRKYGVSDNAIRKWCDYYQLPRKKTEIKKYSIEEWNNI